jgi:transposase
VLVGSDLGELIDTLSFEAYSLYAQGMTYREIAYALGIKKEQVKYNVVKYARKTCSPYPLPARRYNGEYLHALYTNGMSVKDIALLMSLHQDKVYLRIKRFCADRGLPYPFVDRRAELALSLREAYGHSYEVIAKMAGYTDRSNCYRAIKHLLAKKERGE